MKENFYIVDRIEGNYAVVEDNVGNFKNINLEYIKGHPKEGDLVYKQEDYYIIDKEATLRRKEEMEKLMKGMWIDE